MSSDKSIHFMFNMPARQWPENEFYRMGDIVGTYYDSNKSADLVRGKYKSRTPVLTTRTAVIHIRDIPDFVIDNLPRLRLSILSEQKIILNDDGTLALIRDIVKYRRFWINKKKMNAHNLSDLIMNKEMTVKWSEFKQIAMDKLTDKNITDEILTDG